MISQLHDDLGRNGRLAMRSGGTPEHTHRVLVVDDQEPIRVLLEHFLAREGYEVRSAGSGAEALLAFAAGGWDFVITDRMMPNMTGDELASRIRTIDARVPIILVSGSTEMGPNSFSFDAVVPKPFTGPHIVEALQHLTRVREAA